MANGFISINELLDSLEKTNSGFLNGDYFQFTGDGADTMLAGRTDAELTEFNKIAAKAKEKGLTVKNLFTQLEAVAHGRGLQLVASPSGRNDNTYNIIYVPSNDSRYRTGQMSADQQAEMDAFMQSLPQFTFSGIDSNGLISVNGQKTINQGMIDIEGQEVVYYTMMEKLLREQLHKFSVGRSGQNTSFLRNLDRMTNNSLAQKERDKAIRAARGSVKYTTKNVMSGSVSTSNFQGLVQEFQQAIQGIGSKRSRDVRKGYVNMKPLLDALVGDDWDVVHAYQKQYNGRGNTSLSASKEQVTRDLMTVLSLYSQATDVSNIEDELNVLGQSRYRYLTGSKSIKSLRGIGQLLNSIHPDIGTSQEGSISNYLLSFVRNRDIGILGGLDDKSNRKRVQVANTLQRMQKAQDALRVASGKGLKSSGVQRKKLYTAHEQANGLFGGADGDDYEYGVGFATEEEIRKAGEEVYSEILAELQAENAKKAKPLSDASIQRLARSRAGLIGSAHSGGIYYSSKVKSTLDSEQLRTMSVDQDEFQAEVERILQQAAANGLTKTNDEAMHQAALNFVRDKFHINASDLVKGENGRTIDISDILTYGGADHRVLSIVQKRLMQDGAKIMGNSDFSMKGTGTELDQRVIDRVYRNRGVNGDGISFLRNPEALDIRSLSGLLEGYVRRVFGAMDNNQVIDSLASSPMLKNWFTFNAGSGNFVLKEQLFDRDNGQNLDEKTLLNFIDALNQLKHNMFADVFSTKDGKLSVDFNRLQVATGVSQFAGYEYGQAGRPDNLNVDYRFRGALDRGLTAASMGTRTDLSVLSKYLLGSNSQSHIGQLGWTPNLHTNEKNEVVFDAPGLYNGDAESQRRYGKWFTQLQQIRDANRWSTDRTKNYGLNDILDNNDLVLGYGGIDQFLSQYGITNFQSYMRDKMSHDNPELTGDALQTYIDDTYQKLISNYIDLSDDAYESLVYDHGHITKDSWDKSVLGAIQNKGKGRRTIFAPSTGGFYTESGTSAVGGHLVSIPDLSMFDTETKVTDEHGNVLEDYVDLPAAFKSLFDVIGSERYLQEQRILQSTGDPSFQQHTLDLAERGLSESVVQMLATFISEAESKNGSLWQQANKTTMSHAMFGSAVASPSYNRSKAPSTLEEEIQRRIDDVGITISTADAEKLLGMQDGDQASTYLKALEANYHYLYDETKSFDDVEKDIESLLKDTPKTHDKIRVLLDKLIASNTIGSEEFNKRLQDTNANGGTFRGLSGQFLRYPLSNGLDVQSSELFFDSSMSAGSMMAGLGIGHGVNLDFDGDKIVFHLDLTNGDLLKEIGDNGQLQQLLTEKKASTDFWNQINSAIAYTTAEGMMADQVGKDGKPDHKLYHDKNGVLRSDLEQEDLQKIFNQQAQETAAILSRLNKGYTGLLSNNYQAITETLASLQAHSDNVPLNNAQAKEDFVRDMITRGVFEGFTQDAISSKKVVKRIAERDGITETKDWTPNATFFDELNQLMSVFKSQSTYSGPDALESAFKKALEMGIFKEGDMFSDRITSRILATTQRLYTDEKGNVDLAGYAKALRLDEGEARKLLYTYDDKGRVASAGYTSGKNGLSLKSVMGAMLEADEAMRIGTGYGLGSAQINKAKIIPGGMDASSNPTYRLGSSLWTAEELEKTRQLDPALASLIEKYGTLATTAESTTKALSAEAAAEQEKIGIAGKEAKAITAGTTAYKDRMSTLRSLGKILKDDSTYNRSTSASLNQIFGNDYGDSAPFMDAMIEKYQSLSLEEREDKAKFGITPELMGYPDAMGAQRFAGFSKGYWAPVEGKIADALEQVLTEVNQELFKLDANEYNSKWKGNITSYDQLLQFLNSTTGDSRYDAIRSGAIASMRSGVKGAEGVEFLLGTADYSGRASDYLHPDANGQYIINGQVFKDEDAAFIALKDASARNGMMFQASYGEHRADLMRQHYLTQGQAQFAAIMAAAGGDISRVGGGEQELIYSPEGKTLINGRADRIVYGKRQAGDENLFGESTSFDQDTVTVFDKKVGNHLNPRYIAQVMQYIQMLQQIQETIQTQGITSVDDLMRTDLGKIYQKQYGKNFTLDETLFQKLAGGAAINGGLLMTDRRGRNTRYDIGFNNRTGQFNLTGNRDIDATIMSYLREGVSYDTWDPSYQQAFTNAAKVNEGAGNQTFTSAFTAEQEALKGYEDAWKEYYSILKEVHDLTIEADKAEAEGNTAKKVDLLELIRLRSEELATKKAAFDNLGQSLDESGTPGVAELSADHKRTQEILERTGATTNAEGHYTLALKEYQKYQGTARSIYQSVFGDLQKQKAIGAAQGLDTSDLETQLADAENNDAWQAAQSELQHLGDKVNSYIATLNKMITDEIARLQALQKTYVDNPGQQASIQKQIEAQQALLGTIPTPVSADDAIQGIRDSGVVAAQKATSDLYSDARSQYVTARKQKTEYLRERDFYTHELDGDKIDGHLTDEVREEYEAALKEINEHLLIDVQKTLDALKNKIFKVRTTPEGDVTSIDDEFTKLYKDTEARQGMIERRNSDQGTARYERSRRAEDERNGREAYAAYSNLGARDLALIKNQQAIDRTKNPETLSYLQEERKALEELRQLAQDTVDTLEAAHRGNGANGADSANDQYWQRILTQNKSRADAEYRVKANDIMAKGTSAYSSQFQGIFPAISKQISGYVSRFFTGMGIYRIIAKLKQSISSLCSEATSLDKTMTNLQITTGSTRTETRNLMSDYANLGKQLGATTQEVAESALEWQRQGYDAAEVTDLVTSSLYLSKLGMIDTATATKDLTSALKGFKMQASESMDVVDKLTAIDLEAATSAGEIAEGLAQFANLGSLSGVDIDEAAAYVATISDVTQMSGSSAGQALKTIISRYGNVKAGAYNELTFDSDTTSDETLNDVEKVLKKLGISVRDSNLSFKDFDDVLGEIADKWNSLDNVSKKAIANAFAGVRQQEAFTTLMQNWDKYEELLDTSRNSEGTAETKYDAYKESLEASKNAFQTTWEELANNAQVSEFLKTLYDIGTHLGKITPFLIKNIPQLIIAIEQFRTLSGKGSLIEKGIAWLGNNGVLQKGGIKNLFFGGSSLSKGGAVTSGMTAGTGINFFSKRGVTELGKGLSQAVITPVKKVASSVKGSIDKLNSSLRKRQPVSPTNPEGINPTSVSTNDATAAMRTGVPVSGLARTAPVLYQTQTVAKTATESDYKLLGVSRTASPTEIKQAYHSLAKTYHPDNSETGDQAKFVQIQQAYDRINGKEVTTPQTIVTPAASSTGNGNNNLISNLVTRPSGTQSSSIQATTAITSTSYSPGDTYKAADGQTYKMDSNGRWHDSSGHYAKDPTTGANSSAQGSAATTSTSKGGSTAGKLKAGAAVVSYAAGQLASGLSAYMTGGMTHTTESGETVTSSERAHDASRAIETGFSAAIPIVGPILGQVIGNAVGKKIDAERDRANENTKEAQEHLATLEGMTQNLTTMSSLIGSSNATDVAARKEASESLMQELYKSDNDDTRKLLQKYLSEIYGQQVTLNDVMKDYNSNNKQSQERAAKALEIAQKKAERAENRASRDAELYEHQESLDDQLLKYNSTREGYDDNGLTKGTNVANGVAAGATGAGVAGAVGLGSAAVGLATAAAVSASVPVAGWIVGAILAIGAGVVAGIAAFQAFEEDSKEDEAAKWDELSLDEKMDVIAERINGTEEVVDESGVVTQEAQIGLQEQIDELDKKLAEDNTLTDAERQDINSQLGVLEEQLAVSKETLTALEDYQDYLQSLVDEDNEEAIEEALLKAGSLDNGKNRSYTDSESKMTTGTYLMDMSVASLKDMGIEGIYEMLADAIDPDDLVDMEAYVTDENGNKTLSQQFIEMATSILQSDDEIASVLSGESYSLSDALAQLGGNTDQFSVAILQRFADALGTTVDQLSEYTDTLGTLSLADLLKSSKDLIEDISSYTSLLGSVTDATQSSSEWMSTIISQYPDLISYMSDTPTLISKLVEKIAQLNQQLLNSMYTEYSSSSEYFKTTIKTDIDDYVNQNYGEETAGQVDKLIKDKNITTMDDLNNYLVGLDETDVNYDTAQILREAYLQAGSGTTITANAYTEELQEFTEYIADMMQDEVDALNEQKDALEDINSQREYEIKLMEAKMNLEDAINNKQRVYRAGVGFVYEADQSAVSEAQKNLDEVENEKEVSKITKQIDILQGAIDEWTSIWDTKTEENKEQEMDQFAQQVLNWENGIADVKDGIFNTAQSTMTGFEEGSFAEMNTTLNTTLTNGFTTVVDATVGVSTSVSQQTQDILNARENEAEKARTELAELWEEYEKSVENGESIEQQNAKLAAYRNAFSNAVNNGYINANSYGGWTASSSNTTNTGETDSTGNTTTFGGEDSYTAGTGTDYKHANHTWAFNWGNGGTMWQATSNTEDALSDSDSDAVSIMSDAESDPGKGGRARYWTESNYKSGGSDFKSTPALAPQDGETKLSDYAERIYDEDKIKDMIIVGSYGDKEWAWLHAGRAYKVKGKVADSSATPVWNQTAATGTLDSSSGISLLNELGTEAIVTPQGTIAALPAHSGVIPADITKNLWELGEIAPNILRVMDHYSQDTVPNMNQSSNATDESFNISNLTMNVSADNSFDADAFVDSIRSRVALTRHTR